MSLQNALFFLQKVRTDQNLQEKVNCFIDQNGCIDWQKMGEEENITFRQEDLYHAFKHDYNMRKIHYQHNSKKNKQDKIIHTLEK